MRFSIISSMFVGLLLLCFMSGQATVQAELLAIQSIAKIIKLGVAIFGGINGVLNPDKTTENVELILKNVKQLTSQLDTLATHLDTKLDTVLNTLLNDIEITFDLQNQRAMLLYNLHNVDHFYDDSLKFTFGGPYDNSTLVKFTERVLYDSDNLPKSLVQMHDIFNSGRHYHLNPGFLSLILQKTKQNLPTDCKRNVPPQQLVYYIYIQLVIAELKGLATLKNVYTTKWLLNEKSYNFAPELNDSRAKFEARMHSYYKVFTEHMAFMPRQLRRCHVNSPKRGVDFFELEKFSRIDFLGSGVVGNLCWTQCPDARQLDYSLGGTVDIYNCTKMRRIVTVCRAGSTSSREYLWWRDFYDEYYGRETSCSQTSSYKARTEMVEANWVLSMAPPSYRRCKVCACSMDRNVPEHYKSEGWRVSLSRQTTDIWNNMIVTGVKFVFHKNAVYLQIQQGNFSNSGMIHSNITWNELDTRHREHGGTERIPISNKRITHKQKTIHLDDIILPAGYAVTGVGFTEVGDDAFQLWVHGTLYNFETGTLDPSNSCWCYDNVCKTSITAEDYKRTRFEITMDTPDDPTRGTEFHYDLGTNKKIKFTHTDVHKDAGQTTIPFFDMQPIHTRPVFPLSGIGLYYRGREGFGGYIAPRIYTLDVTNYMKIPATIESN